jgi:hypothetical protein
MIDADAMLWPTTSPITSPARPAPSGKTSYQSPPTWTPSLAGR